MLALCVVIPVVALLPGHRVYGDANNCFGYALASLGNTEHHEDHDGSDDNDEREGVRAGGRWGDVIVADG